MLITTSEKDIYRFGVLSFVSTRQLRLVDAAVTLAVLFVISGAHFNRRSTLGAQNLAHVARIRLPA